MKAIFTLLLISFFATTAAQSAPVQHEQASVEVATQEETIQVEVEVIDLQITEPTSGEEIELARLFKNKHALVKKELSFRTHAHRAKLA